MLLRKKIIIGIHGLGNKPPAELLEKWWTSAILEGLRVFGTAPLEVDFEMVYWADTLYPEPEDTTITNPDDPLYTQRPYIQAEDYTIKPYSKTRKKLLDYLEKVMDQLFLNDDMSINFSRITDKFIHKYFKDLDAYYSKFIADTSDANDNIRTIIRERLYKKLIKHRRKDILLIAHSMGSIVAFDVLSQHSSDIKVDTLVTIGSPLGIPVVMNKIAIELAEAGSKLSSPQTPESLVRNWFNLSDLEDKIAINYNLTDDYQPNSRGIRAVDYIVYNNYINKGNANPHSSFGYLRTPEMAGIIEDFSKSKRPAWYLWTASRIKKVFDKFNSSKIRG